MNLEDWMPTTRMRDDSFKLEEVDELERDYLSFLENAIQPSEQTRYLTPREQKEREYNIKTNFGMF